MTSPEDLEARVTRLEQEIARLRIRVVETSNDAAAARILAGGADRDVAEIREEVRTGMRAHTQALNALRETQREFGEAQLEMRQVQYEMRETLRDHGARITTLETTMRSGFAEMKSGMGQIVTLLGGAPPA